MGARYQKVLQLIRQTSPPLARFEYRGLHRLQPSRNIDEGRQVFVGVDNLATGYPIFKLTFPRLAFSEDSSRSLVYREVSKGRELNSKAMRAAGVIDDNSEHNSLSCTSLL